ncbi:MAG: hypothetical protein AAFX52_01295 [Pseudomonadota bacterium]
MALDESELLEVKPLDDDVARYRFRFKRRQGSSARAMTYGLLAIGTAGVSEAFTTPIEGSIQDNTVFLADAICSTANETCTALMFHLPDDVTRHAWGDESLFLDGGLAAVTTTASETPMMIDVSTEDAADSDLLPEEPEASDAIMRGDKGMDPLEDRANEAAPDDEILSADDLTGMMNDLGDDSADGASSSGTRGGNE